MRIAVQVRNRFHPLGLRLAHHALLVGQHSGQHIGGVMNHPATVQHDAAVGILQDAAGGMRHHQDGDALLPQCLHALEALVLKADVAHRKRLVDDEDFRIDAGLHGECQAHIHAAGVGLDRAVDELADIRKSRDFIETSCHLFVGQTQNRTIHEHVFAAGEFRIETRAQIADSDCHAEGFFSERERDVHHALRASAVFDGVDHRLDQGQLYFIDLIPAEAQLQGQAFRPLHDLDLLVRLHRHGHRIDSVECQAF